MKRRIRGFSLIVAGLVVLVAGCASGPEVEPEYQPAQMDAATTYQAASQYLPADAMAVGAMAGEQQFDEAVEAMLPTARPDARPGEEGTVEGLREDLRAEYREMFGFDPTTTQALAVAMTRGGLTAVMFGDYEQPTGLESTEVDGRTAFELPLARLSEEFPVDEVAETAVLVPVDEPRPGMVITTDPEVMGTDSGSDTRGYDRLFDEIPGATFALGALTETWGDELDGELEGVDVRSVLIHYGDADFGMVAEGDDQQLAQIDEQLRSTLQGWNEELAETASRDDQNPFVRALLTYGHHGLTSVLGQLEDSVDGDRVHYDVARAEGEDFALFASLGITAATVATLQFMQTAEDVHEELEVMEEEMDPDTIDGR